jgi:hypothetical protein
LKEWWVNWERKPGNVPHSRYDTHVSRSIQARGVRNLTKPIVWQRTDNTCLCS